MGEAQRAGGLGSALRASSEGRWKGEVLEARSGEADTGPKEVKRMVSVGAGRGARVSDSPHENWL